MAKQEDENYWTSSVTKGFNFDSEDNVKVLMFELDDWNIWLTFVVSNVKDNFSELFGISHNETTQLSKQVQENIPQHSHRPSHLKLSASLSSLSSTSSSSSIVKTSQPTHTCLITNKLLTATINVKIFV